MDLDRELRHLGAREVVIQADCEERHIRMDGRLRSDARLNGPGIILSFESKHGPLSYPCDTYVEWTDNLRAISLALEALRAVDRYGVTRRAEQYRGWKQLPDAIQGEAFASVEEAARFLLNTASGGELYQGAGDVVRSVAVGGPVLERLWRECAKRVHPDRAGGSTALMSKVNAAKDYIERHRRQA